MGAGGEGDHGSPEGPQPCMLVFRRIASPWKLPEVRFAPLRCGMG
jgi:hypothetical protein